MSEYSASTRIVLGGEECSAREVIHSPKGGLVTLAGIDISTIPLIATEKGTTELMISTVSVINGKTAADVNVSYTAAHENTYSQSQICDCINVDGCPNVNTIKTVKSSIEQRIADF